MRSLAPSADVCIYLPLGEDQFESAVLNWPGNLLKVRRPDCTHLRTVKQAGPEPKFGVFTFGCRTALSTSDGSSFR